MSYELGAGLLAGVLQAVGYAIYISRQIKREIEPNAATWLMFAYGTLLLTILEWDSEAPWYLLLLPAVCAALSLVVAIILAVRGQIAWPKDRFTQTAFVVDVLLTIGYLAVGLMQFNGLLSSEDGSLAVLLFLVLSNASTAVAFFPLLRDLRSEPHLEQPLPWVVWTCAYVVLGVATYLNVGLLHELMIYPVSCAVLHGTVAILSRRR